MGKKIDAAVSWALAIANDNSHGYSMEANRRWGTPDYDCSSFVISAWQEGAGVPVKTYGATFTGNMLGVFLACGFKNVINSVNTATGYKLQKGDVLLNIASHTCLYVGNGMVANARTDVDGVIGDSSGTEIRIQPYWDYKPWDAVLRYIESDDAPTTEEVPIDQKEKETEEQLIPLNSKGIGIAMLQGGLKHLGYNLGWYGVDGDSGGANSYTNKAIKQAVSKGEISKETVEYLINL